MTGLTKGRGLDYWWVLGQERRRLVAHLEKMGLVTSEEAEEIRARISRMKSSEVRPGRTPKKLKRFANDKSRARWVEEHFDEIWMYRVPFYLFPDGSFLTGIPGDGHSDVLVENLNDVPEDLDLISLESFQGYVVFHPKYGVIEQWPVNPETGRQWPGVTDPMKRRVREDAERKFESYGPGTRLHSTLAEGGMVKINEMREQRGLPPIT